MDNISLREAKSNLAINVASIDEAIMEQPVLFYAVSDRLVKAKEEKDSLKMELNRVEAETSQSVRKKFIRDGEKFTEGSIKAAVALDDAAENAYTKYNLALSEVTAWEYMKEAYSQRSFMLRELAHLWAANYYGDNSLSGGNAATVVSNSNRRKLSSDRKERTEKRTRGSLRK